MLEELRFPAIASEIALEIERKGVILGVDWNDRAAVDALAREALSPASRAQVHQAALAGDHAAQARDGLFGLASVMLEVMAEGASDGQDLHGNDAWKAFARALWAARPAAEDGAG